MSLIHSYDIIPMVCKTKTHVWCQLFMGFIHYDVQGMYTQRDDEYRCTSSVDHELRFNINQYWNNQYWWIRKMNAYTKCAQINRTAHFISLYSIVKSYTNKLYIVNCNRFDVCALVFLELFSVACMFPSIPIVSHVVYNLFRGKRVRGCTNSFTHSMLHRVQSIKFTLQSHSKTPKECVNALARHGIVVHWREKFKQIKQKKYQNQIYCQAVEEKRLECLRCITLRFIYFIENKNKKTS